MAVEVRYEALSHVLLWPANPKKHAMEDIVASIESAGYVNPLVVDDRTGMLVAGHGRVEALKAMKDAGKAPPDRIREKDGEWYVPVLRGVRFNSDAEAAAYAVADNRLVERGGWDEEKLTPLLRALRDRGVTAGSGFDDREIAKMLKAAGGGAPPSAKEYDESVADGLELKAKWTVTFPSEHRATVEAAMPGLLAEVPGLVANFE